MKTVGVSREEWLNALLLPQNCFVLDLVGYPLNFEALPGWQIMPSRLDAHLLYYCRKGEFRATVDGKELTVSAGGGIWMRPGTEFSFLLPPGKSASFMRFRMSLHGSDGAELVLSEPCVFLSGSVAVRPWLDVIRPLRSIAPPWLQLATRAAVAGFLASTFAADEELRRDDCTNCRRLSASQIWQLETFVEERGPARTTVTELAAQLRLSRDYFLRLFLATFQRSARKWLIEQRVRSAAQRLAESALSISEVADEYGYSSIYFFSRQFKTIMDTTPTAYRRQIEQAAAAPGVVSRWIG